MNKIKSILKKNTPPFFLKRKYSKLSYSQRGEDLIISSALSSLGMSSKCTYLDIGAHHPFSLSNTYKFYQEGAYGLLVEPDPVLYKSLVKNRPRDQVLNVGIGFGNQMEKAKFYVMSARVLNTFSREEAERINSEGTHRIITILDIDLVPINLLFENFIRELPDFVTIDVEGLDYQILKTLDFNKYRPPVFCVETLEFRMNREGKKIAEIIDLFEQNNYFVYADTWLNTVFVDKRIW